MLRQLVSMEHSVAVADITRAEYRIRPFHSEGVPTDVVGWVAPNVGSEQHAARSLQ